MHVDEEEEEGEEEGEESWVQCDRCSKWREVAAYVDESSLPEVWFCSMNSWDK
ncbi:hypothetical protein B484DRAFT_340809, partial [Ochromonadaceae sp. CCMP2298]